MQFFPHAQARGVVANIYSYKVVLDFYFRFVLQYIVFKLYRINSWWFVYDLLLFQDCHAVGNRFLLGKGLAQEIQLVLVFV